MKEQTGVINSGCFTRTVISRNRPKRTATGQSTPRAIRKEIERMAKHCLPTILAGSGISAMFLTGLYFFLVQLAEHGL